MVHFDAPLEELENSQQLPNVSSLTVANRCSSLLRSSGFSSARSFEATTGAKVIEIGLYTPSQSVECEARLPDGKDVLFLAQAAANFGGGEGMLSCLESLAEKLLRLATQSEVSGSADKFKARRRQT